RRGGRGPGSQKTAEPAKAAGRNPGALRAEGDRLDLEGVPDGRFREPTGGQVPDVDEQVLGHRDKPAFNTGSYRLESDGRHSLRVLVENAPFERVADRPAGDSTSVEYGQERPSVGAEFHSRSRAGGGKG